MKALFRNNFIRQNLNTCMAIDWIHVKAAVMQFRLSQVNYMLVETICIYNKRECPSKAESAD